MELNHLCTLSSSNPSVPLSSSCCLLLDFSNAFNCIDRSVLFRDVRSRFPALSRWLEYSYGTPSNLLFGDFSILSCSGVQQGDPLGPLAFSTLQSSKRSNEMFLVSVSMGGTWTMGSSQVLLMISLHIIENLGPPVGFTLTALSAFSLFPLR